VSCTRCASRHGGSNNIVIAHELMHTLGATDKYELGSGAPLYPLGFAEPDRQPLYPQVRAEIMAGRRALSPQDFELPQSLRDVVVVPRRRWRSTGRAVNVQLTARQGLAAVSLSVCAGARELVRELSVEFAPGEVVAILGRNGSGKTLTLHTLAGLRRAAAGEVWLDGAPLPQFKRRSVRCGWGCCRRTWRMRSSPPRWRRC